MMNFERFRVELDIIRDNYNAGLKLREMGVNFSHFFSLIDEYKINIIDYCMGEMEKGLAEQDMEGFDEFEAMIDDYIRTDFKRDDYDTMQNKAEQIYNAFVEYRKANGIDNSYTAVEELESKKVYKYWLYHIHPSHGEFNFKFGSTYITGDKVPLSYVSTFDECEGMYELKVSLDDDNIMTFIGEGDGIYCFRGEDNKEKYFTYDFLEEFGIFKYAVKEYEYEDEN